jgi:hypothetical protein
MSKTTTVTGAKQAQVFDWSSLNSDRLFYLVGAGVMLFLTLVGFRGFYLHGNVMTAQIVTLIVVHGLAMSVWVILFFTQATLIVIGNRRLHMMIGPVGAVLGAAIVILGLSVALSSVHFNPELYKPFCGARCFLAFQLTAILSFGTLVGIGIRYRFRAEIHRPMMLLATLVLMPAPLDRWPFIPELLAFGLPLYHYGPMLLLGGLLFLLQWGITGRPNRWFAIGYAGIVITSVLSVPIATSAFWDRIAAIVVP